MQMNSEKLLIVGCGDLGQRLARELQNSNYTVIGLRRTPPATDLPYLDYRRCNIDDHAAFASILSEGYSVIVVTMTPSERSDDGYRRAYVDTCQTLVDNLHAQQHLPRLLLFVSSTGVYGEDDDSLIDEDTPTQPTGFSGQRLLDAENIVRNSGFAHCIVRFSGIYGPGRNRLIQQVREGRANLSNAFTNRIHADDCAGVLAHLLEQHRLGQTLAPVYIASDCAPAPMREVVEWLAEQMKVSLTPPENTGTSERGNKRCSNQALLNTGYRFRYPDYRAGYSTLLAESS
jgi:nucleoside-diphosphate-sugar epimerase